MGGSNMSRTDPPLIGTMNEPGINNRMGNPSILGGGNNNPQSQQQVMDFRSLNTMGKLDGRSNSKTSEFKIFRYNITKAEFILSLWTKN